MRVDKAKNIAKVDKILIKKPLLTQREIAEEAEVWLWTVNRIRQELEKNGTKDDRIIWITDTDLSILLIGQREIERRLNDREEVGKMRTVEISQVIKESTARYSLFRWSATDSEGGLRGIESIIIE
jgi:hypothetical protein